jgi:hypothetical protein
MADDEPTHCLNCGTLVVDNYCSHCGQKNTSYRVSLWLVLKEMLGEAFELDGRVPRTLVPFFFEPGLLTREYNEGKRARYTSPFRLFLVMTLMWVAAGYVFAKTTDYEAELAQQDPEHVVAFGDVPASGPIPDPETKSEPLAFTDEDSSPLAKRLESRVNELNELPRAEQAKRTFEGGLEALPKAMLLLLPVFALVLKVLFLGTGRYYVEHLVFALHIHAMAFFTFTVSFLIDDDLLGLLLVLAFAAYVFLALRNAYQARWWTTALRFVGLAVVYGLSAMLGTAIIFLIVLML